MPNETNIPTLDARLATALDFVRPGAIVADIGTDHAYLPAALVLSGRAVSAIAADINSGPLVHAAETVARYGLEDKIILRETDGLHGLADAGVSDILIFGMGGELIARIIDEAPFTRSPEIRLILQPMTKHAELRTWLCGHGFAIRGERMSRAAGKIYQTICAEYTGGNTSLTPLEAELGPCNLAEGSDLLSALIAHKCRVLSARLEGRRSAGLPDGEDGAMLDAMCGWLNQHREEVMS